MLAKAVDEAAAVSRSRRTVTRTSLSVFFIFLEKTRVFS